MLFTSAEFDYDNWNVFCVFVFSRALLLKYFLKCPSTDLLPAPLLLLLLDQVDSCDVP